MLVILEEIHSTNPENIPYHEKQTLTEVTRAALLVSSLTERCVLMMNSLCQTVISFQYCRQPPGLKHKTNNLK